eukprot:CAMPEP_0170188402 /NCGR_PEP_ID=MMETSP0040_2-20121228/44237_1 /TAXON_ID=641309 /ORGANISM="Lotharella oceanica, Strain CCMP622" /LENGTH=165 /DNA_ID=CAMNT_0010435699 /DNA_START=143 /DNA_END=637 /DNA_ORIENTATION=+
MAQPAAILMVLERPIFLREYFVGTYSVATYLLSKLLVELPVGTIQVLYGLTICYWMVSFQAQFVWMFIPLAMLGMATSSFALCLGAIAPDIRAAMDLLPIAVVPQFLYVGLFIKVKDVPMFFRWPQWICGMKHAMMIMDISEFHERNAANDKYLEDNYIDRDRTW